MPTVPFAPLIVGGSNDSEAKELQKMVIKNQSLKNYKFLDEMYKDGWFPNYLVDKGKNLLIRLCEKIESENPKTLDQLYMLTHEATEAFNDLEEEFEENDSEIETVARECIGANFFDIAKAYGFDADREELIAPRNW
jgi:hypothetical protein